MNRRTSRQRIIALLLAGLTLPGATRLAAHDIPARVAVRAFVRPEGRFLRVIVRVPLEAMRDLQFPLRGPGYLDLARVGPLLDDAARLWIAGSLALVENGRRLDPPRLIAARVSLPSDRSFENWETALAHVTGPLLANATELVWQQGLLDVLLEYPIESDHSAFSIRPTLARLGLQTTTVLRFLPPDHGERAYQFTGTFNWNGTAFE